jgi:menaquinol-cytochrome c reductase cytochrome b/c subunit
MKDQVEFHTEEGYDARERPIRLLVVQEDAHPAVHQHEQDMVMTVPHLVVRELIAFVAISIVLVLISLLFDAPLEELANPEKTPNPAKAPWYFLGLQELLHYYPPLISGVVLPSLVVVALVVVPYFLINLERKPLYQDWHYSKMLVIAGSVIFLTVLFYVTAAHPVWSLIGSTWLVGALMLMPGLFGTNVRVMRWLSTRSIGFWVFTWFLIAAVVLTVIGTFFRGPGWAFTLPWRDGIY